jgi:hypothetical protein
MSGLLDDIRKRNEDRKMCEAGGVIGGVRQDFDIDFLLRHIDRLQAELDQAREPVPEVPRWEPPVFKVVKDGHDWDYSTDRGYVERLRDKILREEPEAEVDIRNSTRTEMMRWKEGWA